MRPRRRRLQRLRRRDREFLALFERAELELARWAVSYARGATTGRGGAPGRELGPPALMPPATPEEHAEARRIIEGIHPADYEINPAGFVFRWGRS